MNLKIGKLKKYITVPHMLKLFIQICVSKAQKSNLKGSNLSPNEGLKNKGSLERQGGLGRELYIFLKH